MPYAIITRDRTDAGSLRADTRAAHLEYLKQFSEQIIAGGGFLTDAGELDGGGLIIVDTEDRQEAERLAENDPFGRARAIVPETDPTGVCAPGVDTRRVECGIPPGELGDDNQCQ